MKRAKEFEKTKKPQDVLAIAIVWIGHVLDLEMDHKQIAEDLKVEKPENAADGSEYY